MVLFQSILIVIVCILLFLYLYVETITCKDIPFKKTTFLLILPHLTLTRCKHVDDVLIDAPWEITHAMIKQLNIQVVASGNTFDSSPALSTSSRPMKNKFYKVPKGLGIYAPIQSSCSLTVDTIVGRIYNARKELQRKFDRKSKADEVRTGLMCLRCMNVLPKYLIYIPSS